MLTEIEGVLHVLARLRNEPGFVDSVELSPTVQCTPGTYNVLPHLPRPAFLDVVQQTLTGRRPGRVLFDSELAEEGGRFLAATIRYVILEVDHIEQPPHHRWLSIGQLVSLVHHSHYVNVQARTLLHALGSLISSSTAHPGGPHTGSEE